MKRGLSADGAVVDVAMRARGARARVAGPSLRSAVLVMALIGMVGLIVTASLSWTVWRVDRNSEHRLLVVQTRQAASFISAAIVGLQAPLQGALDIADATTGDAQQFTQYMSRYTGPGGLFAATSLWRTDGPAFTMVASTGAQLALPDVTEALNRRAASSTSFVVSGITNTGQQAIGYALTNPTNSTFTVYAERAIPTNRRVPVESTSAFADLHFATYLGPATTLSALQTTDMAPNSLPLSGNIARESIPFGDTTVTLVTSPVGHLGGALGAQLPWIVIVAGVVLTAVATLISGWLVRRRSIAERDARTIASLYERLDEQFGEQRTISETLQRALLPMRNPVLPNLEIASRYVAGATGVDVGGDWYSIIQLDSSHFGFVVGDVSGRGVNAAAHMGRIRFTLRAYLIEGHPPHVALNLCNRQLDFAEDGHFATVLVGVGDLASRVITLANAGHLNPIVVSAGAAHAASTKVGPPLGITAALYESTTIAMPPQSMLVAFTDGLVERRDEDIDAGIKRLEAALVTSAEDAMDDVLSNVLSGMSTYTGSEDDIAILGFRWRQLTPTEPEQPQRSSTYASAPS